jgi:hypothetical protein
METAEHAAVASLAPIGLRGSAFGLLAAVQGFGNLAASAVAGALWTALSGQAAFLISCGLDACVPRHTRAVTRTSQGQPWRTSKPLYSSSTRRLPRAATVRCCIGRKPPLQRLRRDTPTLYSTGSLNLHKETIDDTDRRHGLGCPWGHRPAAA